MNLSVACLAGVYGLALVALLLGLLFRRRENDLPPSCIEKVRVWWVNHVDVLVAAILALLFVFMGLSTAMMDKTDSDKDMNFSQSLTTVLIYTSVIFLPIFTVINRVKINEWLGLRWRNWWWVFAIVPVACMATWFSIGMMRMTGFMQFLETVLNVDSQQDAIEMMQKNKDERAVYVMAFMAAILAPIVEETVFRGYLYPVVKRYAGMWAALISTSLLFSAAHGNVVLALPLFLLGFIMALAYELTGSLWANMAIHFCFNATTVIILLSVRYANLTAT